MGKEDGRGVGGEQANNEWVQSIVYIYTQRHAYMRGGDDNKYIYTSISHTKQRTETQRHRDTEDRQRQSEQFIGGSFSFSSSSSSPTPFH